MAQPSPKGNAIPARPTLTADLQLLIKYRISTSRPTRNRNRTSPRFAIRFKLGIEAVGKIASEKPGMRPITEGPSRIPPMTSAITRGWRIRERGQCSSRQKPMMMLACDGTRNIRVGVFPQTLSRSSYLDDEQDDGVLRVVNRRILAFQDTTLRSCTQCASSARSARGADDAGHHLSDSRHVAVG